MRSKDVKKPAKAAKAKKPAKAAKAKKPVVGADGTVVLPEAKDQHFKKGQLVTVTEAGEVKASPTPALVQEAWERGDYAWIAGALGVEEQLVGHYSLATLLEKCGAVQK